MSFTTVSYDGLQWSSDGALVFETTTTSGGVCDYPPDTEPPVDGCEEQLNYCIDGLCNQWPDLEECVERCCNFHEACRDTNNTCDGVPPPEDPTPEQPPYVECSYLCDT
jgi:hypothetical protein